ncbi:hypothetical protein OCU04_005388 [Sclerotinia nivalis]|uniref:Uncharacterized protein n=1 Tax=Sclerotinia nivalis TaxID=352851 RepID=A0A9X0AP20_9HELO|nr:hypothetical protein OCU04_005388 [Sclerotinia nivalis]
MYTPSNILSYLTLLPLLHSLALAHPSSQEPLTSLDNSLSSPEKCLSYSATFLTPYTDAALEAHATAQLPGFCEGNTEKVALHPNIVEGWGWVMDFSGNCGCDGLDGDGSERFWVYFPIEVIAENPTSSSYHQGNKSTKKKCHDEEIEEKQVDRKIEIEIMEPWILHAEGCERNRGDLEINEGLGTCEEGTLRTWHMGVGREDWRGLRGDEGMVWVVEGWDSCEELEGRLGSVDGDGDVDVEGVQNEDGERNEDEELGVKKMLGFEL